MQTMRTADVRVGDPDTADRTESARTFGERRPSRVRSLWSVSAGHLSSEWRILTRESSGQARWRRPAFSLGVGACALIIFAAWLQQMHPWLGHFVLGEQASLWWPVGLVRMPGSLFAPALRLPMWGALAQVLFCFGLAETHLGRRTAIVMAIVTHAVATASARVFVVLGPHAPFGLGLPNWVRWQRDTGPSAAVVGLGTYLGVTLRVPVLTAVLVGAMVIETVLKPDLADREHLVAIAVGGLAAVAVGIYQGVHRPSLVVAAV